MCWLDKSYFLYFWIIKENEWLHTERLNIRSVQLNSSGLRLSRLDVVYISTPKSQRLKLDFDCMKYLTTRWFSPLDGAGFFNYSVFILYLVDICARLTILFVKFYYYYQRLHNVVYFNYDRKVIHTHWNLARNITRMALPETTKVCHLYEFKLLPKYWHELLRTFWTRSKESECYMVSFRVLGPPIISRSPHFL